MAAWTPWNLLVCGMFTSFVHVWLTAGKLNQTTYQQLLEPVIPRLNTLMSGVEWWYQHDGAPYHAADSTQEFLQDRVPGFFTRTGALPYSDVRAHWLHVEWPPNS